MEGFAVLVEKDWLAFGHKFATRVGHTNPDHTHDQRAPIFLQFLDTVYQLIAQFPDSFEFNENFLIAIYDSMISCRFGNFLFDSDRERTLSDVHYSTSSMWTFLMAPEFKHLYVNPMYVENLERLIPRHSMRFLKIWEAMYLRWDPQYANNFKHADYPYTLGSTSKRKLELLRHVCQNKKTVDTFTFDSFTSLPIEDLLMMDPSTLVIALEENNVERISVNREHANSLLGPSPMPSISKKDSEALSVSKLLVKNEKNIVNKLNESFNKPAVHSSSPLNILQGASKSDTFLRRASTRHVLPKVIDPPKDSDENDDSFKDGDTSLMMRNSIRKTTVLIDAYAHQLRQLANPTFALNMLWPPPELLDPPE
jgi:hypothetical protein